VGGFVREALAARVTAHALLCGELFEHEVYRSVHLALGCTGGPQTLEEATTNDGLLLSK
jgi:hypothetical protein